MDLKSNFFMLKYNGIPSSSDVRASAAASCCCGIVLRLDLVSDLDPDSPSVLGLELRAASSTASSREVASEKSKQ